LRRLAAALVFAVVISASGISGASQNRVPWYEPLTALSHSDRVFADCVMLGESRSTETHPNPGTRAAPFDANGNIPGYSGLFQMANYVGGVWDSYAMPTIHVVIWRATPYQQAEGFVLVLRKDGRGPWRGDGCFG
jgi:hypothetical protein